MIVRWNAPRRYHHHFFYCYIFVELGKWISPDKLLGFTLLLQLDFVNRIHISLYLIHAPVLPFSQIYRTVAQGLHEIDFSVVNITCQQLKRIMKSAAGLHSSQLCHSRAITFVALIMRHYFIRLSFASLIEKWAHIESEFTHRWMD
jgi:hypothetical protein